VTGHGNSFFSLQSGTVAGNSGHSQTVTTSGNNNTVSITQTGTAAQTVSLGLTGSSNTVTVTQGPN